MSSSIAIYGYHPDTEWFKEREDQYPGADMYCHWMKTINQTARECLGKTREAKHDITIKHVKQQPYLKVGALVMLSANNIRT